MGGTRFIGVYLSRKLLDAGHTVTLFTRGKSELPKVPGESDEQYNNVKSSLQHIKGDRGDYEDLANKIKSGNFDVVYDINAREAEQVEPIIKSIPNLEQYIFCSSAGVYKGSDVLPHREVDETDFKSRHKGKLFTEDLLDKNGVNYTSIRPVYIYGPLNYNPVEEWFFHRVANDRPVPVPNSGLQVTQLGHVDDLADAFLKVLGNEKASKQVYNISGDRYVTFSGLAKAAAIAAGKSEPEIVLYNPKEFDFGKAKAFPLRDVHFFTSIEKAKKDLDWAPKFSLVDGLKDSWQKDYSQGRILKKPDFTPDDLILGKK